MAFPCDRLLPEPGYIWLRGIDVEAPPAVLFAWLCQLRAAPYSYDLIDNWGRRSPRTLTPGLTDLDPGQRFMTMFTLAEFEADRQLTLRARGLYISYVVEPRGAGSRLLAKAVIARHRWAVLDPLVARGDLLMMRKQFRTLAALAARSAGETRR
jgi:hypothetical protein